MSEPGPQHPRPPRLLDRVRAEMRLRRYILFHGVRHPDEMGAGEVSLFLSNLVTLQRITFGSRTR